MNHAELSAKYAAIIDITKRRRVFLQDVVDFYRDENRARDANGKCVYSATPSSPGCAIGRCLNPRVAILLPASAVTEDDVFDDLPPWMQDMGRRFLNDVQLLHDRGAHWGENGITVKGREFAAAINLQR